MWSYASAVPNIQCWWDYLLELWKSFGHWRKVTINMIVLFFLILVITYAQHTLLCKRIRNLPVFLQNQCYIYEYKWLYVLKIQIILMHCTFPNCNYSKYRSLSAFLFQLVNRQRLFALSKLCWWTASRHTGIFRLRLWPKESIFPFQLNWFNFFLIWKRTHYYHVHKVVVLPRSITCG